MGEMRVSLSRLICFFSVLGASIPVMASPIQISGRLYTDQYLLTQGPSPGSLEQSSLSGWADLESQISEKYGARVISQVDAFYRDINHPDAPSLRATLREGYLSYLSAGIDLRAGQQIIPWGKSDGVNPTDYFTAKNFTLLNADDEVKRIGAPGVNLSYTPDSGNSPLNFQAVIQVSYPQMKLLIPDQATQSIPAGIRFQKYPDAPGYFQANSMEYGIKASYLKPGYDFSLSFYQGYTHFSEYVLNPLQGTIAPINPAETAIGGDASFTWKEYVIRLETALHMPENGKDSDPIFGLVEPWHWDSTFGAERPIGDDFRIQAQLLYRWHLYFPGATQYSPLLY